MGDSYSSILRPIKRRFFSHFFSPYATQKLFRTYLYFFLCSSFNSVAKNLILDRKSNVGSFAPFVPLQVTPVVIHIAATNFKGLRKHNTELYATSFLKADRTYCLDRNRVWPFSYVLQCKFVRFLFIETSLLLSLFPTVL